MDRSFTLVMSPFLRTSSVFSVRASCNSEMWQSPSVPGVISMKAPKVVVFFTGPS